MKVVILKPEVIELPEGVEIPAGLISAVPAPPWEASMEEQDEYAIPDFTIELGGQLLSRQLYPELHSEYPHTGGFHQFQVENMERRVLMGFEDGKPILGTGIIYFQGYPPWKLTDD